MDRIINAVLIDDDLEYSIGLSGLAREHNINITSFNNLQKAKEEMPGMSNLDFLILDGKCFIDEGHTTVEFNFVSEALLAINDIQLQTGRYIQHCLNTGYVESLERYKERMPVFEKVTDQEKLFNHIIRVVSETDEYRIQNNYKLIFEIFHLSLLSTENKYELIELIKEVEASNPSELKNPLRRMRLLIEAVLLKLNEKEITMIPLGLFRRGVPEISKIIYHLGGKPKFNRDTGEQEYHADQIFPEHIYESVNTLYGIISKVAMHHYEKQISAYIVKSCFYALLEFLLWFKNFSKQHYINN